MWRGHVRRGAQLSILKLSIHTYTIAWETDGYVPDGGLLVTSSKRSALKLGKMMNSARHLYMRR
eukprot:2815274-Pleurochrysis_carterae.AAC.4